MTKAERIVEYFENHIPESDMVQIHNKYCELTHNMDDYIYQMWEIDDMFAGKSVVEIINDSRDINIDNKYLCETLYGWESFDWYCDCSVSCMEDIANYCVRNDYDFNDAEIFDILNNEEEEENE